MTHRIAVLGAAGGIGQVAARTLALAPDVSVVLADRADGAAEQMGARFVRLDVEDADGLAALLGQVDVVVNCVGPFYRFGPPLLRAAIEAGIDYVDVCDDLEPTVEMLGLDAVARERGVRAVVGLGNSPGLANVLVRFAADHLLDSVESVDIMHVHGGEPDEGGAVLRHRIHAMTNPVPVWDNGQMHEVRMLEESGAKYVQQVEFRDVGTYPVYPYPHPETITLPRFLPGVQRVTNRGVVFPLAYFELTCEVVRTGMASLEPLRVAGGEVVPRDVAVEHLRRERPRLMHEAGVTSPAGCLRIDVHGRKDGEGHGYAFSLSSSSAGAGEGTGIPAALGALMLARGEVAAPGVHPPEAAVDPLRLLALAGEVVGSLGVATAGGGLPLHIAHTLPDGSVEEMSI